MNRIVKTHYPVEKLPKDLRAGLPAGAEVTVTVEADLEAKRGFDEACLAELDRVRGSLARKISPEEATDRIRSLRDEWDD